jgi:hypothetical protein
MHDDDIIDTVYTIAFLEVLPLQSINYIQIV